MTPKKFKIGDRVEVLKNVESYASKGDRGKVTYVSSSTGKGEYPYAVKLEKNGENVSFIARELKRIEPDKWMQV